MKLTHEKDAKLEKGAFLFLMLLAGIFGGLVRWIQLRDGFDAQGLAIPGERSSLMLLLLCVCMLAALGVIALLAAKNRLFPSDAVIVGAIGVPTILFAVCAAAAGTAGTVAVLITAVQHVSVWGMLNGLLLFAATLLTVPVLKKLSLPVEGGSPIGTASLLLVFWACFRLIEVYREVSSNPSVSAYFYDIAALITMILMFFACSGYLYGRKSAMRVYLAVAANLFFCTTAFLGRGLNCLRLLANGTTFANAGVTDALIFLYGFLFTLAVVPVFFAPRRADPVASLLQTAYGDDTDAKN